MPASREDLGDVDEVAVLVARREQVRRASRGRTRPGRRATTCSGTMSGPPTLIVDVEALVVVVALRLRRVVAGELRLRHPLELEGDLVASRRRLCRPAAATRRRRRHSRRRRAPAASTAASHNHLARFIRSPFLVVVRRRSFAASAHGGVPAHDDPLGERDGSVERDAEHAGDDDRRPAVLERRRARPTLRIWIAERILASRRSTRRRWPRSSRARSRPSSAVKRYGSEVGMRTRRKIVALAAPRRSASARSTRGAPRSARAACSRAPGRSTSTAAIAIFEAGRAGPEPVVRDRREGDDRDRVRRDRVRHAARARAAASARARAPTSTATAEPIEEAAERLLEREAARRSRACRARPRTCSRIVRRRGQEEPLRRRGAATSPSQSAMPRTKTTTAGAQSRAPRPHRAPDSSRGTGWTTARRSRGAAPRPSGSRRRRGGARAPR